MQPKFEPVSPPGLHSTDPNNLEDKSIHDLVMVLRGTCEWETFDRVEGFLVSRDMKFREENQKLQQDFEIERLKLKEEFHMERLSRLHAEAEFKKREEICEKVKKVQESYEALLKEVKVNRLADRKTNEELEKKNNELEMEFENLKEKYVDASNEIYVLRRKNGELEDEVLEFKKLKEKWEDDDNELCVLRKMTGDLESKVLELTKSKEKWEDDNNELCVLRKMTGDLESKVSELTKLKEKWRDDKNALDGLRIEIGELKETAKKNLATMSELRNESRKLAEEKFEVETLLEALKAKFKRLRERVAILEGDIELLVGLDDLRVANFEENDGEDDPMVANFEENEEEDDPMVANFEENEEENVCGDEFRNEDAHLGVAAASTQPLRKGSKDAQGASSGEECWMVYARKSRKTVEMEGSCGASARVKLENKNDTINLDKKKANFGIAVKSEDPSSSMATQQKTKFANAVDMVKRKISFSDLETSTSTSFSTSTSSDDSSFLNNLTIRSAAKKKKM